MSETRICECGGTMHHSDDMENPFDQTTGDCRPFFQCEDCGEIVDENGESEAELDADDADDTDKATARPWRVVEEAGTGTSICGAGPTGDASGFVTLLHGPKASTGPNAALIVRCVNSHDSLVGACELFEDWATGGDPDNISADKLDAASQAIFAALAEAKP